MKTRKELYTMQMMDSVEYLGMSKLKYTRLRDDLFDNRGLTIYNIRRQFIDTILKDRSKVELLLMGVKDE